MKRNAKPTNKYHDQESVLYQKVAKDTDSCKKNNFFNTFDYLFLSLLAIIIFMYLLSYFEEVSWQLSSLGRIIMIRMLPYYDWRYLKNKQCLIDPFIKETEAIPNTLNCYVCEDMIGIDVHDFLEESVLEERYINLDHPVIITNNLENWPNNSSFMEELKNEKSSKLYPCNLSTNIYKGLGDLETILPKLKYFERFFIHFQNCEIEAMRVLRKYTFRPDVLPSIYSPTSYNWLIWNKNYNVTNYKQIELVEKVTVLGQLFGSTYVRLIPRKNCENICPFLEIVLQGGELLIFTSLWDLEYRPAETGENMAVIMEYRG